MNISRTSWPVMRLERGAGRGAGEERDFFTFVAGSPTAFVFASALAATRFSFLFTRSPPSLAPAPGSLRRPGAGRACGLEPAAARAA
ncbi:hypothetical protein, partial [Stenotrophomonas sp. PS02297]|uniref:hypothetical protein n=1 Tax=Stenotrophomonas sp. PS02297 TaxID=2991423 RepID=UPI00249B52AB